MGDPINLSEKLATFRDHWRPRIVGAMNDLDIMVVKVNGDFQWHRHDDTDDFFLILRGVLEIDLREAVGERTVVLHPGELFVVPRGVEHHPAARHGEVEMLLIEPKGTPNTGDRATAVTKLHL